MPAIEVGQPSSGGGIAGIPTKYLVIGGGAIALAFFFLNKKSGGGSAADPNSPTYGTALGPNAALALGDLQTRLLQQSGTIQEQMQGYFAALGDSIGGLSTHLDTQAAALSDAQTAQAKSWYDSLLSTIGSGQTSTDIHFNEVRAELGAIGNPAAAQTYRDAFNTWLATVPGYGNATATA